MTSLVLGAAALSVLLGGALTYRPRPIGTTESQSNWPGAARPTVLLFIGQVAAIATTWWLLELVGILLVVVALVLLVRNRRSLATGA